MQVTAFPGMSLFFRLFKIPVHEKRLPPKIIQYILSAETPLIRSVDKFFDVSWLKESSRKSKRGRLLMKYMLDANICIYLIKQKPPEVLRHFKPHAIGRIGISSLTLAELRYGMSKSQHVEKNRSRANKYISYSLRPRL